MNAWRCWIRQLPDDWARYDALGMLGESLLGERRYSEAEPAIVFGYEGMAAHGEQVPASERPRLREAAERVVRLYEEWGKPEEAAGWKEKVGMRDLPGEVFGDLSQVASPKGFRTGPCAR